MSQTQDFTSSNSSYFTWVEALASHNNHNNNNHNNNVAREQLQLALQNDILGQHMLHSDDTSHTSSNAIRDAFRHEAHTSQKQMISQQLRHDTAATRHDDASTIRHGVVSQKDMSTEILRQNLMALQVIISTNTCNTLFWSSWLLVVCWLKISYKGNY